MLAAWLMMFYGAQKCVAKDYLGLGIQSSFRAVSQSTCFPHLNLWYVSDRLIEELRRFGQ